jgi:hypothetical protein
MKRILFAATLFLYISGSHAAESAEALLWSVLSYDYVRDDTQISTLLADNTQKNIPSMLELSGTFVLRNKHNMLLGCTRSYLLGKSGFIELYLKDDCNHCYSLLLSAVNNLHEKGASKALVYLTNDHANLTLENPKYKAICGLSFKQQPQTDFEEKHNLIRFKKSLK